MPTVPNKVVCDRAIENINFIKSNKISLAMPKIRELNKIIDSIRVIVNTDKKVPLEKWRNKRTK